MANQDAVANLYLSSFGNVRIAFAEAVSLSATGNAVANLSFANGGLTNGGAVANSGSVIVRKIVIKNFQKSPNLATLVAGLFFFISCFQSNTVGTNNKRDEELNGI